MIPDFNKNKFSSEKFVLSPFALEKEDNKEVKFFEPEDEPIDLEDKADFSVESTSNYNVEEQLVTINIIPITEKIERNFELFIKSGLKNELESFLNKEILEAEYD